MSELSMTTWIGVILVYGLLMLLMGFVLRKKNTTKDWFLVGNRSIGWKLMAFSIAASWIWAPALFVSSQISYTNGYVALLWFAVPNCLCLVIYGIFAQKLRNKIPEGYTFTEYIRERFGEKVHNLYLFQVTGLSVCCFAVQLHAGAVVITSLTGLNYVFVTIFLSAVVLGYSYISGIKASVWTDYVQMMMIIVFGLLVIPMLLSATGLQGLDLYGMKNISGFFSNSGIEVMFTFGIVSAIGLIAGPFADQIFWQRTFSLKKPEVRKSYILGAAIFGGIPILMAVPGFVAAGMGITVPESQVQMIGLITIQKLLPGWVLIPFVLLLIAGLTSTMDSALCSISGTSSIDIARRVKGGILTDKETVKVSRIAMICLTVGGIIIANIQGLTILTLWLFYATFRVATLLPTCMSILSDKIHPNGVYYGLLASFIIGIPIYSYGGFMKVYPYDLIGSVLTLLLSGVITYVYSYWKLKGEKYEQIHSG